MSKMEFPDVHHKMSKKIAQLTKVIYHLNTKNDDNEYQLQQITDLYECEIQEILEDAKRKIVTYKTQLEESNTQDKAKLAVQELSRIHEAEKKEMVAEFTAFRKAAVENESRLKAEGQDTIARLTNDVQSMRDKFLRRVREFEEGQKGLEQKGYDALGELRKIKDAELENTIQEYNEKYKAMLAKQMQAQEDLETSLNTQWEERLSQAAAKSGQQEDALKRRVADEVAKLKLSEELVKTLKADNADQIAINTDLENAVDEAKKNEERLNKNIQNMLTQLNEKDHTCDVLRKRGDELARQAALKDEELCGLRADLEGLQSLKNSLSQSGDEKAQELSACRQELSSLSQELANRVDAYEAQVRDLEKLVQDTNTDLLSTREALASEKAEKMRALMQIDTLSSDLSERTRELGALEDRHRAALSEAADAKTAFLSQIEGLAENLERERESKRLAEEALSSDMDTQLKLLQSGNDSALAELEKAHALKVASLEASHVSYTRSMKDEHNAVISSYKDKIAGIESDLQSRIDDFAALSLSLENTSRELERMCSPLTTYHTPTLITESQSRFDVLLTEKGALQSKLDTARDDMETLQGSMSASANELQGLLAAGEAEAKATKEKLEATVVELRAEGARLKKEMTDTIAKLKADAETTLKETTLRLEAAHALDLQDKLQKLRTDLQRSHADDSHSEQERVASLQRGLEEEWAGRLSAAQEAHAAAEAKWKEELSRMQSTLSNSSADAELREADMNASLERLQAEHSCKTEELKRNFALELSRLEESLTAQKDASHRERDAEHERKMSELRDAHLSSVNDLTAQHNRQLNAELAALSDKHDKETKRNIAEREGQHSKEIERLIGAKELEHQKILSNATKEWETRVSDGVQLYSQLQHNFASLQSEKAVVDSQLEQSKRAHADSEATGKQRMEDLVSQHEQSRQTLRNKHHDELKKARQLQQQNVERLTAEFSEVQKQMKDKHHQLQSKIAELEYRYANRESRDEDIEKINALIADLTAKDEALLRAHNELRWYKLELVNREENYNKVFGRKPTVAGPGAPSQGAAPPMGASMQRFPLPCC